MVKKKNSCRKNGIKLSVFSVVVSQGRGMRHINRIWPSLWQCKYLATFPRALGPVTTEHCEPGHALLES